MSCYDGILIIVAQLRRSVLVSTEKRQFLILLRDEPLEIGYLDSYPTREGSIPSASTNSLQLQDFEL